MIREGFYDVKTAFSPWVNHRVSFSQDADSSCSDKQLFSVKKKIGSPGLNTFRRVLGSCLKSTTS